MIGSFKFLAYHTEHCGEQNTRVISEHSEDYEEDLNREILDFYLKDSKEMFPFSNDWSFMYENREKCIEDINRLWVEDATSGIVPDQRIKLRGIITEIEYEQNKRGWAYKAVLKTNKGEDYTFVHVDKRLPEKGQHYYLLGEVASDDWSGLEYIREVKGKLNQVIEIKRLDEPE
ncbi:hypothetical protein PV433_20480 [Paenibacillus sp. GYB004]|uniref:hypothetical protein n=1 Tax=Paenibacillus sp. GYB004 TaxID=2994393 RepID=UPI002F967A57